MCDRHRAIGVWKDAKDVKVDQYACRDEQVDLNIAHASKALRRCFNGSGELSCSRKQLLALTLVSRLVSRRFMLQACRQLGYHVAVHAGQYARSRWERPQSSQVTSIETRLFQFSSCVICDSAAAEMLHRTRVFTPSFASAYFTKLV